MVLAEEVEVAAELDDGDDRGVTVPVAEEQAVVRKRKRITGGVRVRTVIR